MEKRAIGSICTSIRHRANFPRAVTGLRCRHDFHDASLTPAVARRHNFRNPGRFYGHTLVPIAKHYSTSSNAEEALKQHKESVSQISATVRRYYERKEKFRIFHGSTNSTRQPDSKKGNFVNLSSLNNVLKVDATTKTALVEPNVPMDRLVEATMAHGLIPPVVMDFPGITVGGGYAGTSGESSSYRHGFFDRTMNYVEMVLANGEVIRCSDTERPDLFHAAAGAVGTLGTTRMVELQLRDVKDYVEVTYHPVSSIEEAARQVKLFTADPTLDYVDGIMYSPSLGAIVTGKLTDTPSSGSPIRRFSDANDPWYYLHVQDTISSTHEPVTEALPLAEYLFRYDRGGFWVGAMAFEYFKFPFNAFTRWWLDDFLHTRMMYTALHKGDQSRRVIIQDLALPYSTAAEFVEYTDEKFNIYPLWLCPLKQSPGPTFHPHTPDNKGNDNTKPGESSEPEQMLSIGLWGYGPSDLKTFVSANKDLESKLRDLGGKKWLYAHTYYDEPDFWAQYGGRKWYDSLREKYHATGLPSVYEKVKVDVKAEERQANSWSHWWLGIWPLGGFWGIWKAIQSKAYVDARASSWKTMKTLKERTGSTSGK